MDIRLIQAVHLGTLDVAHPALGGEHEDAHPVLPAEGVLGGRASVPARRAKDVEDLAATTQDEGDGLPQELHGQVLESHRGALRQADETKPLRDVVKARQRDHGGGEALGPISLGSERAQVLGVDIGGVQTDDPGGELGVTEVPEVLKVLERQLRHLGGDSESAVRCEPGQEHVGETEGLHAPARGDELHVLRLGKKPLGAASVYWWAHTGTAGAT